MAVFDLTYDALSDVDVFCLFDHLFTFYEVSESFEAGLQKSNQMLLNSHTDFFELVENWVQCIEINIIQNIKALTAWPTYLLCYIVKFGKKPLIIYIGDINQILNKELIVRGWFVAQLLLSTR